jgi:hypothetical protein
VSRRAARLPGVAGAFPAPSPNTRMSLIARFAAPKFGQGYYFAIEAFNEVGVSKPSAVVQAK